MKLRQKLAVVMAAAMVVTAVPVVTSATTTNALSISSVSIVKDGTIGGFSTTQSTTTSGLVTYTATKELTLDVLAKSSHQLGTTGHSFFVTIENAKFSKEAYHALQNGGTADFDKNTTVNPVYTDGNMTVTVISDTELRVTVTGSVEAGVSTYSIPVFAVAESGEVSLKVDGTDTFVTSGTYVLGTTSSKTLSAAASGATKLNVEGGKVGKVVISEATKGAFAQSTDKTIEIKLPSSSDLEFGSTSNIKLTGSRGFDANLFETLPASAIKADGQTLTIDLSSVTFTQSAAGQIVIDGIEVLPENKTASKGDVVFTVKNKSMETTKITVAEIVEEGITLTCKEPAEIISGKDEKTVTFKLAETTKDAIIDGRKVDFTIENGFIAVREYDKTTDSYLTALETIKNLVASGAIELPEEVHVEDIVAAEANTSGQITGFTVEFDHLEDKKASELEFTMPIRAAINTTGDVKVKVEGRAIEEAKETVIATAKAPFEVKAEAAELKVGLNGQVAGKLTINETAAEMFDKGSVTISMTEEQGISFKAGQALDIKAENLTIKDVKVTTNTITFAVARTSDEAGSIEIDGIEFNVNRVAPEGSFDVAIYGEAISTNTYMKSGLEKLSVKDFVVISTKNTEDITASNGLKAGTATFSIDSTTYTVNGEEKTMDGTPYLSNGRTMVPVRYVSEAFGIAGDNVVFNKGVVTLFAGNRIVQLTNGSNVAVVNGVSIAMDEAVVIKDGRTYIPVGEVGRLLGVNVSWDNETKTATFTN